MTLHPPPPTQTLLGSSLIKFLFQGFKNKEIKKKTLYAKVKRILIAQKSNPFKIKIEK